MAGAPTEFEMEPNAEAQAAESEGQTATTEGMPEPPSATDASAHGAVVAASPEWPAADLVGSDAATALTAGPDTDAGAAEANSTTGAISESPLDAGDDSDAPIQLDDAQVAADLPAATPALAQHVTCENINLSQGGVQSIKASSVTLSQGGAGQVWADEMTVQQGGVGMARAGNLTLQSGSSAFAVVADEATIEEGANTFLVVSRSFSGDVRPTIDWRTGLAFGAGLGLALSILRRLR